MSNDLECRTFSHYIACMYYMPCNYVLQESRCVFFKTSMMRHIFQYVRFVNVGTSREIIQWCIGFRVHAMLEYYIGHFKMMTVMQYFSSLDCINEKIHAFVQDVRSLFKYIHRNASCYSCVCCNVLKYDLHSISDSIYRKNARLKYIKMCMLIFWNRRSNCIRIGIQFVK